jgi:hypothetical protein
MPILDQAKRIAHESAQALGGAWVVIGNPSHNFTKLRDVSITEAETAPALMLPGDVVLYRVDAA